MIKCKESHESERVDYGCSGQMALVEWLVALCNSFILLVFLVNATYVYDILANIHACVCCLCHAFMLIGLSMNKQARG